MRVIVASANQGKVREIGQILAGRGLTLVSLRERFDPPPSIPETGDTFEANARLKASWVYDRTGEWSLADDSGLEVDALDGAPGVYSARFAGEGAGDRANLDKLLKLMSGVPSERRRARFRCVVAFQRGARDVIVANGTCEGRIVQSPRGTLGFGYDPVFVPDGFEQTFAELSDDAKNRLSHRGKALASLLTMLGENTHAHG